MHFFETVCIIFIDKLQVFSCYIRFYNLIDKIGFMHFFDNKVTTILHLRNSETSRVTLNNIVTVTALITRLKIRFSNFFK